MRYSILLGKISGTDFSVAETKTSVLLSRLGFLHYTGDGAVSFLPLGTQVLRRMEGQLEAELDRRGAQKVELPQLIKQDSLYASGRYEFFDGDVLSFRDEKGEEFFQTGCYEEIVVEFLRHFAVTDRDFPVCIYFYTNKIRPVKEQTGSALGAREYKVLNIFSAHRNDIELNNFIPMVSDAFRKLLESWKMRMTYAETELDRGFGEKGIALVAEMEGKGSDSFFVCPKCGYAAKDHVAKSTHPSYVEELKNSKKIKIPLSCNTYEKAVTYLGVPDYKMIRCSLFRTENSFVLTMCRGDYEISREKLIHETGGNYLRAASQLETSMFAMNKDFLSPIGVCQDGRIRVIADETVIHGSNFILGTGEEGYLLQDANLGVDFDVSQVADIAVTKAGDLCIQCGSPLNLCQESEVVRLIKTGSQYSQRMGLRSLVKGKKIPVCLGSYSIDLFRTFFIVADQSRDSNGFAWPQGLAPFPFYLYSEGETLKSKDIQEELHSRYSTEILWDDRPLSVPEKEKTARLLGIPYIIVISDSLSERNCLMIYSRATGKKVEYPIDFPLLEFKNRNNSF